MNYLLFYSSLVVLSILLTRQVTESAVCHCQDQQACDTVTGFCTSGECDTGWQPFPQCQTECSAGRFGQNCAGVCHCPVGDTCVKTNGLCSSGVCLHGWSGPSCQTRLPVLCEVPSVQVLGPEDVLLSWRSWSATTDTGQGPIAFYQVQHALRGSSVWLSADSVYECGASEYSYTVQHLQPDREYSFRLVLAMAVHGKHKMSVPGPSTDYFLTQLQGSTAMVSVSELLPPMNLRASEATVSSVQMRWQAPPTTQSLSYMLTVEMQESHSASSHAPLVLHTADTEVTVQDLESASLYRVSLTAHSHHSPPSQPARLTFWTKQPPFPTPPPPTLINVTQGQVYATIHSANYSHAPAPFYKVLMEDLTLAEACPSEQELGHLLAAGQPVDIEDYSTAQMQGLPYYCTKLLHAGHFTDSSTHDVLLGDNTTSAGIWNTALYSDHEYVVWTCLQSQLPTPHTITCAQSREHVIPDKGVFLPNTVNVAAIVCGVLFSLLFIILLILLLIYCYRKHKEKKTRYQDIMSYHLGPTLYDTSLIHRNTKPINTMLPTAPPKYSSSPKKFKSQQDIHLDTTQTGIVQINPSPKILSHPIACKDLINVYENMDKSVIDAEFQQLPHGLLEEAVIGRRPENQESNRSCEVLPYDKNRVRLLRRTALESDYVNASNVKSHMHSLYLVSQAPVEGTAGTFWRLVWEQNVDCVVMLVGEGEEGGGAYWPEEGGEVEYGGVRVELMATSHTAHYTVRWLQLTRLQDGDRDLRHMAHFQYHTWTEGATPHHPIPFLDFSQRVHDTHQQLYHILVHCRLGAGRSGLFVALNALLYEGKLTNRLDILRAVQVLRQERPGLVATKQQYHFLYEVLVEAFHYRDTRFQESKFEFIYDNMLSVSTPNNRSIIATEFDCLTVNQRRPALNRVFKWRDYSGYYSPAKLRSPIQGGVPNHGLVEEPCCELLMAEMDSHRQRGQFLVTLYPCKLQQVLDWWHMVYEEHVTCVLMMSETDFSQPPYWPAQGERLSGGGLVVSTVATEMDSTNAVCVRDIEVEMVVGRGKRRLWVRQFQWRVWPQCREVPGVDQMLHLVRLVRGWVCPGQRLVVHSAHGVSRSAMVCAVWMCVERLEEEGAVDVYRATRYTRSALSAALTNLEQYRFLYKVVKEKLHKEHRKNINQFDRGSMEADLPGDMLQMGSLVGFEAHNNKRGALRGEDRGVALYPRLSGERGDLERGTAAPHNPPPQDTEDRGDVQQPQATGRISGIPNTGKPTGTETQNCEERDTDSGEDQSVATVVPNRTTEGRHSPASPSTNHTSMYPTDSSDSSG